MFLAAGPYFQHRFATSKSLLSNFQATELSISTIANLGAMFILVKLQKNASYPRRIAVALVINVVIFTLLAISTKAFRTVSAGVYFGFLMSIICIASLATGFLQNGAYGYAAGYGGSQYIQALMTGQGIAGVLPPMAQIVSVLSAGGDDAGQGSSTSAMAYFLTATGISVVTIFAFFYLLRFHSPRPTTTQSSGQSSSNGDDHDDDDDILEEARFETKQSIPLARLLRKLHYPAAAIFLTFAVTMLFPVYTQIIVSVQPNPPLLFQKASFIPLAFLVWNFGDLLGRMAPLSPRLSLVKRPLLLLVLSIARIIFIPLYLLCNIQPPETSTTTTATGTIIQSDLFYLLIVQFPFGLSNGYLGSCCMMCAPEMVEEDEREAAGGFMGLVLVLGLAVGSLCSFFVGNTV